MSSWTAQKKTGTNSPGKNNLLPHSTLQKAALGAAFCRWWGNAHLADRDRSIDDGWAKNGDRWAKNGDGWLPAVWFWTHAQHLYTYKKGKTKKLYKLYTKPYTNPTFLWFSVRYGVYSLCCKLYTNYTQTIHWTLHWESKRQRVKKTKRLRAKDERTAFLRH